MKTIKVGEDIKRVDDAEADKLVSSGRAKHVSKSVWKQIRDKGRTKTKQEPKAKEVKSDAHSQYKDVQGDAKSKYQRKKAMDN